MKRLWILAVLAAGALGTGFYATHHLCQSRDCDEMTWLKREFGLNESQLANIAKLQNDYAPECATHCADIAEARHRITTLVRQNAKNTPEYQVALQDWQQRTAKCNEATRSHVQRIAALMEPAQAQRYLSYVLPLLDEQAKAPPSSP